MAHKIYREKRSEMEKSPGVSAAMVYDMFVVVSPRR